MTLIAASWPSKRLAAVTKRRGNAGASAACAVAASSEAR